MGWFVIPDTFSADTRRQRIHYGLPTLVHLFGIDSGGEFGVPECKVELADGSLAAHEQAQNSKERPPQWATPPYTPDPRLYRVSFPISAGSIGFIVGGCKGRVTTRTNLRIHFVHRHIGNMVLILEGGNRPHPFCPSWTGPACDMFVTY